MNFEVLFGGAAALIGALVIFAWRMGESRRPISARMIVLPPAGMSTGFAMFVLPQMRVPLAWGVIAFLAGALLLSIPLSRTSRLERVGDVIMMRRSNAFLFVLVGLVAARFLLRTYVDAIVPPLQSAALFYLLAFGMIIWWRARMLIEYRALTRA